MKIIAPMPKVSKKNVVVFNCRAFFNHFAVVNVIFSAKYLQTLNCFAVKRFGQKIRDKNISVEKSPELSERVPYDLNLKLLSYETNMKKHLQTRK